MNVTTIGAGNLGRGIGHRLVYQRADGVLPNICFQHLRHTCAMLPLTKGSYLVDSRAPLARHSHNVGLVLAVMSSIGERGAVVMERSSPHSTYEASVQLHKMLGWSCGIRSRQQAILRPFVSISRALPS